MKLRITHKDSPNVARLKLLYLTPFIILAYLPLVLIAGMKEAGNPFYGFVDIIRGRKP